MVLYCFVCHNEVYELAADRINAMMTRLASADYIIATGGHENESFLESERRLCLASGDAYEHLPSKVVAMYSYIASAPDFNRYSSIVKLDYDMVLHRLINTEELEPNHYMGEVYSLEGDRTWHMGKCSINSPWNDTPYDGPFVPFCLGGYGYILSRKAMTILTSNQTKEAATLAIYEDVFVALTLSEQQIQACQWSANLSSAVSSPDHLETQAELFPTKKTLLQKLRNLLHL